MRRLAMMTLAIALWVGACNAIPGLSTSRTICSALSDTQYQTAVASVQVIQQQGATKTDAMNDATQSCDPPSAPFTTADSCTACFDAIINDVYGS